jgi:ankyrin repeat protein
MKVIMKAIRSFYQRTNFPLLKSTAILLFCFSACAFPLFGQEREEINFGNERKETRALKEILVKINALDFEEIRRLLDAGADPNGRYDAYNTFLGKAVDHNEVQLARVLLEYGADPNLWRTDGQWARGYGKRIPVFYGNGEITALFIAHGARFDVMNEEGISALMSQTRNYESSAILILEWEQRHSPGFSAGFENRKDYLTAVLAWLLDRFYFPKDDRTEIYTLAERLIDAGANPAAMHKDGFPVAYLVVNDSSDAQFIIPLLFERGAPVDAYNKKGQTALFCAANAGNLKLAELLLQKGADIN